MRFLLPQLNAFALRETFVTSIGHFNYLELCRFLVVSVGYLDYMKSWLPLI